MSTQSNSARSTVRRRGDRAGSGSASRFRPRYAWTRPTVTPPHVAALEAPTTARRGSPRTSPCLQPERHVGATDTGRGSGRSTPPEASRSVLSKGVVAEEVPPPDRPVDGEPKVPRDPVRSLRNPHCKRLNAAAADDDLREVLLDEPATAQLQPRAASYTTSRDSVGAPATKCWTMFFSSVTIAFTEIEVLP